MNIRVLYEDNHILAAVKPFNMPSQEDASADPDMLRELKAYIKEKYGKPGDVYLGLVHRLDRPAGGVMLFARTSKAASRLSEAIRSRQVEKIYYAVLTRRPPEDQGELAGYMAKDPAVNTSRLAEEDEPGAKPARLEYEVIEEKQSLVLVKICLHTGRSHQIRVQFAGIGCPLLGDMRYGKGEKQQLALWSYSISFEHPVKREWMTVAQRPPEATPWDLFDLGE